MYIPQALFFNTCRRKKLKLKDKTQAENSRKKLNLSEAPSLKFEKLKKITKFLVEKFWGVLKMSFFKTYIVKNEDIFYICQKI